VVVDDGPVQTISQLADQGAEVGYADVDRLDALW
jgi:hypothetical protein